MTTIQIDHDALLAAVLDAPDDDLPRLAMADWHDEHGDEARAEFIRLQVAKEVDPNWHGFLCMPGAPCKNCRRECALWKHDMVSLGGAGFDFWTNVGTTPGLHWFQRGFVASIDLTCADFLAHAPAIFAVHPVQKVTLHDQLPLPFHAAFHAAGAEEDFVWSWCRGASELLGYRLPYEIFDLLSAGELRIDDRDPETHAVHDHYRVYPSQADALADCSAACCLLGKQAARRSG